MSLTLYDKDNNLKMEIAPSDSSTHQMELQSDNVISLSFTSYECISFEWCDYIDFCGARFWVMGRYTPKQISTVEWEYSVSLYGIESLIKKFLVIHNTNGSYETEFSYTATAYDHVALIVGCINSGMGTTDWKVGEVVESDYITIDYKGTYCDQGLATLADRRGVEYWIDGTTINLSRCEHSESITLAIYNGLTDIYKENANGVKFFTRLFPIGATRNIVAEDYGYTRLQLPGGVKFLDQDIEKFGVAHHYEKEAFAHIYPRRVGTISSVRSESVKDKDGSPYTIYYFKDDSLDFDPNDYEIAKLVKTVTFQDGSDLSGRDFEVNYNSSTHEFEIITQWPYDNDIQLPNEEICVRVGDTYILWNIKMPTEYYTLAEAEYKEAVDAYMVAQRKDISVYKAHTDYIDVDKRGLNLTLGQRIRLEHAEYFEEGYRDSRITKITRNLIRPTDMDLEISDVLSKGALDRVDDAISDTNNYVKVATGNLPDMIKSWESTPPTDTNLFSARRSVKEFVSKLYDDVIQGSITFLKKIIANNIESENFSATLKSGYQIFTDKNGRSTLTIGKINAEELAVDVYTYNKIQSAGGTIVISKAWAEVSRVELSGTRALTVFYKPKDGNQIWRVGNQPRMANSGRYFWGVITAVSSEANDAGEHYFTCSANADKIVGSPNSVHVGDTMLLWGSRCTDKSYKSVTVISSGDAEGTPYIKQYYNIDSFDLTEAATSADIGYNTTIGVKGARIKFYTDEKKIEILGRNVVFKIDEDGEEVNLLDVNKAVADLNSDSIFSVNEKLSVRTAWEAISGRADISHTPNEAGDSGSYKLALSAASGVLAGDIVDGEPTPHPAVYALTSAYQSLLDLFNAESLALYLNDNTPYTRATLSDVLLAYYNAEDAIRSATTKASAAEDARMTVEGNLLVEGKIRADLIDAEQMIAKRMTTESAVSFKGSQIAEIQATTPEDGEQGADWTWDNQATQMTATVTHSALSGNVTVYCEKYTDPSAPSSEVFPPEGWGIVPPEAGDTKREITMHYRCTVPEGYCGVFGYCQGEAEYPSDYTYVGNLSSGISEGSIKFGVYSYNIISARFGVFQDDSSASTIGVSGNVEVWFELDKVGWSFDNTRLGWRARTPWEDNVFRSIAGENIKNVTYYSTAYVNYQSGNGVITSEWDLTRETPKFWQCSASWGNAETSRPVYGAVTPWTLGGDWCGYDNLTINRVSTMQFSIVATEETSVTLSAEVDTGAYGNDTTEYGDYSLYNDDYNIYNGLPFGSTEVSVGASGISSATAKKAFAIKKVANGDTYDYNILTTSSGYQTPSGDAYVTQINVPLGTTVCYVKIKTKVHVGDGFGKALIGKVTVSHSGSERCDSINNVNIANSMITLTDDEGNDAVVIDSSVVDSVDDLLTQEGVGTVTYEDMSASSIVDRKLIAKVSVLQRGSAAEIPSFVIGNIASNYWGSMDSLYISAEYKSLNSPVFSWRTLWKTQPTNSSQSITTPVIQLRDAGEYNIYIKCTCDIEPLNPNQSITWLARSKSVNVMANAMASVKNSEKYAYMGDIPDAPPIGAKYGDFELELAHNVLNSSSGYKKYSGGLLIQWGYCANTNTGYSREFTYPISFYGKPYYVGATFDRSDNSAVNATIYYRSDQSTQSVCVYDAFFTTPSSSGFAKKPFFWIAIGRYED